jgi:hypothetical protein
MTRAYPCEETIARKSMEKLLYVEKSTYAIMLLANLRFKTVAAMADELSIFRNFSCSVDFPS